jgi:hypothetical protein
VISRVRVLVLAKAKGSGSKKQNTLPLRLVRSAVLVCLDIAKFVRDGMTARLKRPQGGAAARAQSQISDGEFQNQKQKCRCKADPSPQRVRDDNQNCGHRIEQRDSSLGSE